MPSSRALLTTVPERDHLGFWADQTLNAREVVRFLGLDKKDVARLAGVAPAAVRFDQKLTGQVLERLEDFANLCGLVAQFFAGDAAKAALWFRTPNPLLGNISPRDMICYGRYEKLRQFVMNALEHDSGGERSKV
jgi:uncharacterized protein (DUF2384 family)